MAKKLQIRLDPDAEILLQEIASTAGTSLSKTINDIIRTAGRERKETADLRAAVAAARAAEEQGRINEEILNSMLIGFSALSEKTYQQEEIHPIVEGARKAEAQRRFERMKGKSV